MGKADMEEERKEEEAEEKKGVSKIIDKFVAQTTLTGLHFIKDAKHFPYKVFWSIVFLSLVTCGVFQIYQIIYKYFQYGTSTSVTLGYDTLPFPSVSFCNINPIRSSMKGNISEPLRDFLEKLNPQKAYTSQETSIGRRRRSARHRRNVVDPLTTDKDPSSLDSFSSLTSNPFLSDTSGAADIAAKDSGSTKQDANSRKTFLLAGEERLNLTVYYEDYMDKYMGEGTMEDILEYGHGQMSQAFKVDETLKELISDLSREDRAKIGHQKNTFIMGCSFNGQACGHENFSHFLDSTFGNCYQFNSPKLRSIPAKSRRSGSIYGLNLYLYIEDHEYLRGLSWGRGVRLAVHSFNTTPFMTDIGISVPPGFATFIGMRLVNISRLPYPYGDCGDNGDYESYYKKSYTSEGCFKTCLDRQIEQQCKCYRKEYSQYYSENDLANMPQCNANQELLNCVYDIRHRMELGNITGCNCHKSCTQDSYEPLISKSSWPDIGYWYQLVNFICQEGLDPIGCAVMKNESIAELETAKEVQLRKNFLALRVYYRDLNYESIEESPSYELAQFLADIGGTLGLWLGVSVISGVEVIDLIAQIIFYFCPCNRRKRRQEKKDKKEYEAEKKKNPSAPQLDRLYTNREL